MFDEAQDLDNHPYFRTKHDSEGVVRKQCKRPWRVYRPGIVVGDSETGEMDKIDGPYYFFKLIRRIRGLVPQFVPLVGVEGREINIVPVDFVVKAMDHIAHKEGLDGKAFHLTDPHPLTAGQVIDTFAQAAHAPQTTVRVPAGALDMATPLAAMALSGLPFANGVTDSVLADFGIPRSVLIYVNYPTHFDSRQTQAALGGQRDRGPAAAGLRGQALGLLGAPPRPRPLPRPHPRRRGPRAGGRRRRPRPDPRAADPGRAHAARSPPARRRHLEGSVRGRVIMVTGASSGIGKSAAMKIADAGGTVLLVARTPEKLEETKEQIEAGGGNAFIHRCDLSDFEDIDRMAEEVLEQHGHVDVLVNNAGRSIRRSVALSYDRSARLRADDPAQLPRARSG